MLFFIELDTRGADAAGATRNPNGARAAQLARNCDDWTGGP